ncbi:MIP family Ig-specific serine endopeptidase [Mycoplasma parvum]|uniref:DUF31 domain-containing protein n=1 Tax=Mycoplasma parvum str. Indiana TaxID=1403316 RepID=U5NFH4_9MOLU|nr:hypothetical protein [Mycoplasma parvum]AGX88894.1 hypothetical protein PRV_00640 [Mycoplasma parvum str. Indiana]
MPVNFPNLLKFLFVSVGGASGIGYSGHEVYRFVNNSNLPNRKADLSNYLSPEIDKDYSSFATQPNTDISTIIAENISENSLSNNQKDDSQSFLTPKESSSSLDSELNTENKEKEVLKLTGIKAVSQNKQTISVQPKKLMPQTIIENNVGDWVGPNGSGNKVYSNRTTNPILNKQKISDQERKHMEESKNEIYYWDYRNNLVSSGDIDLIKNTNQLKEDAKIYKMIKDHTVKLSTPCSTGTGWFLDFELPIDENKYPTKWFVATNLHVINEIRFAESEYNISLPITNSTLSEYLKKNEKWGKKCVEFLSKEIPILDLLSEEDITEAPNSEKSSWYRSREDDYYKNHPIYIQMNENAGNKSPVRSPKIYQAHINNPKLVYAAINFAGVKKDLDNDKETMDYFKDFGVIEVNFESGEVAKKVTNKLFEKYYKNKVFENSGAQVPEKSINFFAPELMSKYSAEELNKNEDHFFIGGYPTGVNRYGEISFSMNQKYKKKYDKNYVGSITPTHSKLTYFKEINDHENWTGYNLTNQHGDVIKGHSGSEKHKQHHKQTQLFWNGKSLFTWGYDYVLDNTFLGGGASGSMVLDKDGALLGLYTRYTGSFINYGIVEPIRGSQVKDDKGRVIIPNFDLIAGKGGDISSYRTQLEKYGKIKTYLSQKENWIINPK